MSERCAGFRAELEHAGAPGTLARLAEHAHARVCPACAAALRSERALERLLEAVPAPRIPPSLAGRVLAGLAPERAPLGDDSLDADSLDGEEPVLEELLARVPAPRSPAGLAERVLVALAPVRPPRGGRNGRRPWLMAAAAALLLAFSLWAWSALGAARQAERARAELELDEELLAYAVERWDLLNDEDLDVWLASLDPLDELLLEYADDETWLESAGPASASAAEQGD